MRYSRYLCVAALLLTGSVVTAAAAPITFDFEGQAFDATTPLVETSAGLSATFSSSTDASGFQISSNFYATLIGNYLTSGADFQTDNTLTIDFSRRVRSITLNFATDTSPWLALVSDTGKSVTASGTIPSGFYFFPEGVLTLNVGPYNSFTSVTLSSPGLTFAIDNVTVDAAPEPAALALLGLGVAGIAARRLRNR